MKEDDNLKFLDIFKQLHINISLIDTLRDMPKYIIFKKYGGQKEKTSSLRRLN